MNRLVICLMVLGNLALPLAGEGARYLLLVELAGGNDGLNTVVPYQDPLYQSARPTLALTGDEIVPLQDGVALNAALKPLLPLWEAGEMAVVSGLGYENPNRSHFRSIDIWETASDSRQVLNQGWLKQASASGFWGPLTLADGLVLGETRSGPLQGSSRVLTLRTVEGFLKQTAGLKNALTGVNVSADARQWEASQRLVQQAREFLQTHPGPSEPVAFPPSGLGQQFATAADLIRRGIPVPVIKLTLRGFDTHLKQKETHADLLRDLAESVTAFREDLGPLWSQVLITTYSEFGRRVQENGSSGTDHGGASVALLWGGTVRGGLYGQLPDLSHLVNGDLVFSDDYRRLWSTCLAFLRPEWDAGQVVAQGARLFQRSYEPFSLLTP